MRKLLHDAAAIADILALALAIYNQVHPMLLRQRFTPGAEELLRR